MEETHQMASDLATVWDEELAAEDERPNEIPPLGEVLAELLALYEAKFPGIGMDVVQALCPSG
jgi:hypothetical protein